MKIKAILTVLRTSKTEDEEEIEIEREGEREQKCKIARGREEQIHVIG